MKLFNKLNGGNKYEGSYNITPGTNNIVIPKKSLLTENLTIMGDSDLVASNIRKNVNLFGVNGSLEEGGIGNYTWEVYDKTTKAKLGYITGATEDKYPSAGVHTDGNFYIKVGVLEDYSWADIQSIVNFGAHTAKFSLKDTKTLTIGSETVTVEIADFNHDDKSDGSGKAGISFILKNCMNTKHNMNSSNTNVNGWPGSAMYSYLNTDIYNQLPSDLQSVIKPVNKITSAGNQSTTLQTSSDKLWLMSRVEAFGGSNTSYTPDGEGTQYPIFTDNTSRIKQINGSNDWYWLRSPNVGSTARFCDVNSGGGLDVNYGGASSSYGVAFGFCI